MATRGFPSPGLNAVARKKTPKIRVNLKASLSRRLRDIRQELFGEHGGPELARRLNLPARTWYNYETGVTVPAEVLLSFIDQTGTNPAWLLAGQGSKYLRSPGEVALSGMSAIDLIRRGLEQLEQHPAEVTIVAPEGLPPDLRSEFIAVPLVPLEELSVKKVEPSSSGKYFLTYREWIPNPAETLGVRLEDDAMHPVLPAGSIAAIDLTHYDPRLLQGRIVVVRPEPGGTPLIRWLEISGKHLILRPNQPSSNHPLIPIEMSSIRDDLIIGQVVWSWSRFTQG